MECPVCKSGISKETLIPLYSKGSNEDPRAKDIPKRPEGERMEAPRNENVGGGGQGGFNFQMGFGMFPGFFMNFNNGGAGGFRRQGPRRQQQQQENPAVLFLIFFAFVLFNYLFSSSTILFI